MLFYFIMVIILKV